MSAMSLKSVPLKGKEVTTASLQITSLHSDEPIALATILNTIVGDMTTGLKDLLIAFLRVFVNASTLIIPSR